MAGLTRFLLAVVMALWLASPAMAQRAADPGTAAADIIRGHDRQTELPRDLDKKAGDVVRRLDLQEELPGPADDFRSWLPDWRIRLPEGLFSIAVFCSALLVAYALKDSFPAWVMRRHGRWDEVGAVEGESGPRKAEEAAVAADELARQGRFVEAMHVLLLQGLADIRRRLDEQFADSLTSREILRNVRVSERGRLALRDIILRVEWSYFGEHPVGAADYQGCRQSFDVLAEALRGDAVA
jgi:hypothetical protein